MVSYRGSEWNRWDLHVHTASSYDYRYKGDDADDLLCAALTSNEIKAVAITDHFTIDKQRIESLRAKAPDIVFFPGVELRTDKGANNLHVILIFSEQSNLDDLSSAFEVIMKKDKAKSRESDETIYWSFEDIVKFAKDYDALLTIHAGNKTNGIDKEISNALPVKQAIKADIAQSVDFFEIGRARDIDDYEDHVFKCIKRKPLIMCSDCHDPKNYSPKENLWIKADPTFAGLKQCLYQPSERVYIGVIPPMLDRLRKDKQANIDSIEVTPSGSFTGAAPWFNLNLPLNPGMVVVIGNKGSGKSAFSDIVGLLCKCRTMGYASFLNELRFRKQPKNYANDYQATITWADGETRNALLSDVDVGTTAEDAQYLPQRYIEEVCNDIGSVFQREIDKVIFSYVDRSERGDALNLDQLVQQRAKQIETSIETERVVLRDLNSQIIKLETKMATSYRTQISDSLNKSKEVLSRHDKSKPAEVKKPSTKEADTEYQTKLAELNQRIQEKRQKIDSINDEITKKTVFINDANALIGQIKLFETRFGEVKDAVAAFVVKYGLDEKKCEITAVSPREYLEGLVTQAEVDKGELQRRINEPGNGLAAELQGLERQKDELISTADNEEKRYQKYLSDLEEWEKRRTEIIGAADIDDTLEYYQSELNYLNDRLEGEYLEAHTKRDELARQLYCDKSKLVEIYQSIYSPVQDEITTLLGSFEDSISFQAEMFMRNANIAEDTLRYIDQRFKGKFGRSKDDAFKEFDRMIRSTDFNDVESVLSFIHQVAKAATEDFDIAGQKVVNRQEFYDHIYGLDYIGVNFKLKMGGRDLDELSPGERGIVLLIFYLALSKESKPIIIDQPEDNLDNQSVYSKLVPCICKAKRRRQVIVVTHNPNIAVACDAEQIIFCEMDKDAYQIRYQAGAIENPEIRNHIVDVLEGTMPAFDLRRQKYN